MMYEMTSRPQDVGYLLVQVEDDLHQLKKRLLDGKPNNGRQGDQVQLDLTYLESAIAKTEQSIKLKKEEALNHINSQVTTVLEPRQQRNSAATLGCSMATLETVWDMKRGCQTVVPYTQSTTVARCNQLGLRSQEANVVAPEGIQTSGLTPAQNLQHSLNTRILYNPYNARNRELMNSAYNIQLPLIKQRKTIKPSTEIVKGSTVSPLLPLPKHSKGEPQLPAVVTEDDTSLGVISLLDRGLIPTGSLLTLDPPPIQHQMAALHSPADRMSRENTLRISSAESGTDVKWQHSMAARKSLALNASRHRQTSAGRHRRFTVPVKCVELPVQPEPPPTTPASVASEFRSHRFACQNGKVRVQSEEFIAFKEYYSQASWGCIVTMLHHVERFLMKYSVPVAFINGDRVAEISVELELCSRPPTVSDLLSVIVNREDVETLINKPGRVYESRSANCLNAAAAKIQATYRMHRERTRYVEYRRKKWAAGVFAISWIMCVKMAQVKRQLKLSRQRQIEAFRVRSKQFASNWTQLKKSRHTIIHIPSLGYTHELRQTITDFDVAQNVQMARLCDLTDPNVDVIYVSPVAIGDEMMQYYNRLLGLSPAIETGNAADQSDLSSRFKVITPEAAKPFKDRRMCLSTLLKYSPHALKRVKSLIHGRQAYIVTGVPHADDVYLSDYLDVPVLCPVPDVAHLYSTKSGAKRIFAAASGVTLPPGELDIYSLQQVHEVLSQLIVDNLIISRWLFKIDDEFDGRGIAFIDIALHLPCYAWCVKESQRYGSDKWKKNWAQEAAYIKIMNELPFVLSDHAQPNNTKAYQSWAVYLQAFISQGGVIEAYPPSDNVTALSVSLLIHPSTKAGPGTASSTGTGASTTDTGVLDGSSGIELLTCGDQIHTDSMLSCWGFSTPQSSMDPKVLNDACFNIASACKDRGIVGYVTVDFVTFIHPITLQQELWVTDLDLSYTDAVAMSRLTEFATSGKLDSASHVFTVQTSQKHDKKSRKRESAELTTTSNRYIAFSTRLYHTNLTMIHYSVFFQMCRAHGIGYDIKEKQGTMFTLVDGTKREHLGMLTISDSLHSVLATFAGNMSVMHQEISAPNMQGHTNFKAAIKDIESILGTTELNTES